MFINSNLKVLRKFFGNSQEEVAQLLDLTRSTYSGYENKIADPNLSTVVKISEIYGLSLDILLKKDLSLLNDEEINAIFSPKQDIEGKNLRILTHTIDHNDNELIELIPEQARAGYSLGYSDPEYLKVLPTFSLPFLSKEKKYRSFPIKGDSMPPVVEGSYVVAEYILNWHFIKENIPYIIVTKEDGIVFKMIDFHDKENHIIRVSSTNPIYEPYEIELNNVLELWKFVNYISPELPDIKLSEGQISKAIGDLKKEISEIKLQIKK